MGASPIHYPIEIDERVDEPILDSPGVELDAEEAPSTWPGSTDEEFGYSLTRVVNSR